MNIVSRKQEDVPHNTNIRQRPKNDCEQWEETRTFL